MQELYINQLRQFGQEVRRLRLENDMTQEELAYISNIDVRTIQRIEATIEAGERFVPLNMLFKLAAAFEVSPSQLLNNIRVPKAQHIALGKISKTKSKRKKK